VSKSNESAALYYNSGLNLAAEGKNREAKKAFIKASIIDKRDADALCEIGHIEIKEGRLESAVYFLDEALSRNPKHAGALNNRGVADFLSQRYSEAADWFRSAVVSNPKLSEAWFNLADTCEELGETEEEKNARLHFKALEYKQ